MDTMKLKLEEALKEAGLSKAEFARLLDVPSQSINNWIVRSSIPKKHRHNVERLINRKCDWLESGSVPKYAYDINVIPSSVINKTFGRVPIISWVQAGDTHVAFISEEHNNYKTVECHKSHGPNSYALIVSGDSMTAPPGSKYTFPEGFTIIVDPDQRGDNTDGIFIIAKEVGNDAVTFKQLKYDGATPYLNPLNRDYPKIFNKFRILGKVIEATPPALP